MEVEVDGWVWLPYSDLEPRHRANIRKALTVQRRRTSAHGKTPNPIYLYEDSEERQAIGVPREFYRSNSKASNVERVMVEDGAPMGHFTDLMTFEGRFAPQGEAINATLAALKRNEWGGAILQGKCGSGKTNMAMAVAKRLGRRTLVIVNKDFFIRQWTERIQEFFPGATVGKIQGKTCKVDCDFVIATVQSLARDKDGKRYAKAYNQFGLVIVDEVHRISAESWAPVIPRFPARYRLGLTATPRRKDNAESVFFHHIGDICFEAKVKTLTPQYRVLTTDFEPHAQRVYGKLKMGNELTDSQVLAQMIKDPHRNRLLTEDIAEAVIRGRKVMVVSERLEHLRRMSVDLNKLLSKRVAEIDFIPRIDYCTSEWFTSTDMDDDSKKKRTEDELERAESANVIFATKQMMEEGLDVASIDVLVLSTPMGDVEQTVGRVQRTCDPSPGKCEEKCPWRAGVCEGKPDPIVTDVVDQLTPYATGRRKTRLRVLRSLGIDC